MKGEGVVKRRKFVLRVEVGRVGDHPIAITGCLNVPHIELAIAKMLRRHFFEVLDLLIRRLPLNVLSNLRAPMRCGTENDLPWSLEREK